MTAWSFNGNCGSNINLSNENKTAEVRDMEQSNNRVVISSKQMSPDKIYEVEKTCGHSLGFIAFGVCLQDTSKITLPSTCKDLISFAGVRVIGDCRPIRINIPGSGEATGHPLIVQAEPCPDLHVNIINELDVSTIQNSKRLGVMVDKFGFLHMYLNGDDQGVPVKIKAKDYYAVFDLQSSRQVSRIHGDLPGKVFTTSLEALLSFLKRILLEILNLAIN